MEKPNSIKADQKPVTKYIRCKQGTERYNMSRNTFMKIASDAGALYKVGGVCLVKVIVFEEYLEHFQYVDDEY